MKIRKDSGAGRPMTIKVWFALWLKMKGYTIQYFAKITCLSEQTIQYWMEGKRGLYRRNAFLLRAMFPDIPIHAYGGAMPKLSDPLPGNARTADLYRYMLRNMDLFKHAAEPPKFHRLTIDELRQQAAEDATKALKARKGAVPPGQPDADRISDVFPPADEGGKPII